MSRPVICAKCGRTVLCEYDGDNYVGFCVCGKVTAFRLVGEDPEPEPKAERTVGVRVEYTDPDRGLTEWRFFEDTDKANAFIRECEQEHLQVWVVPITEEVEE